MCHELAWHLAMDRSRLLEEQGGRDRRLRAALTGHGIDTDPWWDSQLSLCLLGGVVQIGWEKALGDEHELQLVVRSGDRGRTTPLTDALVAAYSVTGGSWQDGPGRIYDRLAAVVVAQSSAPDQWKRVCSTPEPERVRRAAPRSTLASTVVASDAALGMLTHGLRTTACASWATCLRSLSRRHRSTSPSLPSP